MNSAADVDANVRAEVLMVERYRRGKGKRELLGNHQKCWIWGKNTVTESLRAGRWPIHELRLSETLPTETLQKTRGMAARLDIPVFVEPPQRLSDRCRSAEHQGFLAKMAPYPYESVDDILNNPPQCPLHVVLDSIQDPHNFGAILRSADAMAVDAVFVGEKHQSDVTSLVARASAGAVNHVRLARVDNLGELVTRLKRCDVRIVAAAGDACRDCADCDFCRPTALLIGNEGGGIEQSLLELSDVRIRIPQFGVVDSLNAAVAAGILLYEARRQRNLLSRHTARASDSSPTEQGE
jgi:23S rRNA (guanosine2251-2'-O)-methyltransferase